MQPRCHCGTILGAKCSHAGVLHGAARHGVNALTGLYRWARGCSVPPWPTRVHNCTWQLGFGWGKPWCTNLKFQFCHPKQAKSAAKICAPFTKRLPLTTKRLIKKEIHIITNRTSSVVKHHARTRREKGTCDTTSESEAETNGDGSDVARR